MGMANLYTGPSKAVPQESALLKCQKCGYAVRLWAENCKHCRSPETNWYEDRIQELEELCESREKQIAKLLEIVHSQNINKIN